MAWLPRFMAPGSARRNVTGLLIGWSRYQPCESYTQFVVKLPILSSCWRLLRDPTYCWNRGPAIQAETVNRGWVCFCRATPLPPL